MKHLQKVRKDGSETIFLLQTLLFLKRVLVLQRKIKLISKRVLFLHNRIKVSISPVFYL